MWLRNLISLLLNGRDSKLLEASGRPTQKPIALPAGNGKSVLDQYKEELGVSMSKKYVEKYRRSPNQSSSITPKFIVLHHSAGSYAGTVSWILNPASDVSYHYVINPSDGSRIQHVFDTKKAWHAGKSTWKGYKGLNAWSVSIAFPGDTYKRKVSDVEIDSCAKKCLYLMNKFDLGITDIITHEMIAPGRKNDCSAAVYNRVIDRIKKLQR